MTSTPNMALLFAETVLLQTSATSEQLDAADRAQLTFNLAYCAERVLAASVPDLTVEQRWIVAREVAEQHRPGEPVIETVRRWIPESWKETIKRDAKGNMLTVPANAYVLLKYHPDTRGTIRFNLFTKNIEVVGGPLAGHKNIDAIVTAAQDWIHTNEGCIIPFTDLGRRIVLIAEENPFDPIQDYLQNLWWDGVDRITGESGWLSRYAYVEADSPEYILEVGKKFLLAAVSRAMEPGSKTDVVLIIEGPQGLKKSSLLEALFGPYYADAAITLGDKDSKMLASAAWGIELPDMASFKRSEQNALKAFFAARHDTMRVPYGRSIISFPRRCVFATTTNDDEYLSDPTGNRRYWPVRCTRVDLAALIRDRDQIWAQAMHIYRASETCADCAASTDTVWGQRPRCEEHRWWPSQKLSEIAKGETEKRQDEDLWAPTVRAWLANPIAGDATGLTRNQKTVDITTANCLVYAIGKPLGQCSHFDKIRVGKIFRQEGYAISKLHRGQRKYVKTDTQPKPKIALV